MIKFVKSTTECKRAIILHHFGHSAPKRRDGGHNCCDYHRSVCICKHCKTEKEEANPVSENTLPHTASASKTVSVSKEKRELFCEKLLEFRSTLGSSRSCVGSVSLSTGFSLEFVDMTVNNIEHLDSVESILSSLPVFSKDNAEVIFDILQTVLGTLNVEQENGTCLKH